MSIWSSFSGKILYPLNKCASIAKIWADIGIDESHIKIIDNNVVNGYVYCVFEGSACLDGLNMAQTIEQFYLQLANLCAKDAKSYLQLQADITWR